MMTVYKCTGQEFRDMAVLDHIIDQGREFLFY